MSDVPLLKKSFCSNPYHYDGCDLSTTKCLMVLKESDVVGAIKKYRNYLEVQAFLTSSVNISGELARGRRGEDVLVLMELKGKFVEVFGKT